MVWMEVNMTTFTKEEIVPSTKVSRNLSSLLNKLKNHQLEKIAVIRNNEMEAILIPIQEYELMQSLLEQDEYKAIYSLIKERGQTPNSSFIDFDAVLADLHINHDSL
jgi:PHD/YefM family antitoxin component YafN of YafNO toxin-antitoxin module